MKIIKEFGTDYILGNKFFYNDYTVENQPIIIFCHEPGKTFNHISLSIPLFKRIHSTLYYLSPVDLDEKIKRRLNESHRYK